ncbi:multimeric flavodoxin WrbA [Bacillus fengqiuensis]|nr:multimeric flavodoxin WrbA [Bacillus fengqiuensis]
MKILALYGSSRPNGNSEKLAETAFEGLEVTHVYLRDRNIKPIIDQRHEEGGFQPVDDDYDVTVEQVLEHDLLIFITPLYWYGMSGLMKNFVDRWSQSLRDTRYRFKEEMGKKTAYVIVTGGDNPRIKALPLIQQFQYIFDFMGMKFAGYLIGKGSQPDDILQDQQALAQAAMLSEQLRSIQS